MSRWRGAMPRPGAGGVQQPRPAALRGGQGGAQAPGRAGVERSFALILDRGGRRRAWLRGRDNLHKRYLVHGAGSNLGLVMRLLVGAGTPREFLGRASAHLLLLATADDATLIVLIVATSTETAVLAINFEPEPPN